MEPSHDDIAPPAQPQQPDAAQGLAPKARTDLSPWRKFLGTPGVPIPFYAHTIIKPNGEAEGKMWGPDAVRVVRWIVLLILGVVLILKCGNATGATDAILKWLITLK